MQLATSEPQSLLSSLQLTFDDIEKMATLSRGFRSMLVGTSAEMQLQRMLAANSRIASFCKNDDADRSRRSDFTVVYKGSPFRIELKSETTEGSVLLKTSDSVTYRYEEQDAVGVFTTTAMPVDRFDILAVSLFNRGRGWSFAFIEAKDLARSQHKAVPDQFKEDFFASRIKVDDYEGSTTDPFTLFERILSR